ncbi:MAG TPA: hypothetical protein VGQ57_12790, partial [Polyangiaceae bacterium]|nr:hypothetical protein [Polyangiaceae bacterium]
MRSRVELRQAKLVSIAGALGLVVLSCSDSPGGSEPAPRASPSGSSKPSGIVVPSIASCPDAGAASVPFADTAGAPATEADPLCTAISTQVSYQRDVAPLISCSGEICHAPWHYDTLVGRPSSVCCDHRPLVSPGSPSGSHLYQVVTGTSDCISRMGDLTSSNVATLVAWI